MLGLVAGSFPTTPQGWLDLLVVVSLKGTLVLALAGIVVLVLGRASAAVRHLVWSAALIGLLVLPALALWGPGFNVRGLALPSPSMSLETVQMSSAAAEGRASNVPLSSSPSAAPSRESKTPSRPSIDANATDASIASGETVDAP